MRTRAGLLIALASLLLLPPPQAAAAESMESHWYLMPYGGFLMFDKDVLNTIYPSAPDSITVDDAFHAGGRLGFVLWNGLGLEVAGGYTPTKVTGPGSGTSEDFTLMGGTANLIYAPQAWTFGGPFVSAGGGVYRLSRKNGSGTAPALLPAGEDLDQGVFDVAGGLWFRFSDHVALRLEARNLLWVPDKRPESAKVNYEVFGAGLQFGFGGKPRDTDGDGVPDRKDNCPNTPMGARVDEHGCPMDSDGDGVLDGLDQCADTPRGAKVDARGCPMDSDGDGVLDGLDQCADTPKGATVDAKGCPTDSDGDGVFDGLDQCADTPRGATVDARGCPMDSDGDGIFDGLDKCPGTAAGLKVDKDGCPIEVVERETELLDTGMIRLQNVNFETGKADLLPESYPTLDVVGQVLTKWPELKMEVGGHTDSRGSAALNQTLSEARAQSVLDYLTQKFPDLKSDQFTVKGYGKTRPLVPNTNALNMAKNRRVEFVVLNKEVLKREVERRKMLQK